MDLFIQRCVFFAIIFDSSKSLSFPHIFTRGTHYEVGFDIGRTFKDRIQEFYNKHPLLHSKFLPWSETLHGKNIINGFINVTQLQFPLIINEINGIADGAGVTFLETFMLCHTMEIATLLGEKSPVPDSCSTVYFNYLDTNQHLHSIYDSMLMEKRWTFTNTGFDRNTNAVIGHNEDGYHMVKDLGYFVTAHIIERDDNGAITSEERFTHFSYPGVLVGNAFGFNSAGVVQTVNTLYLGDTVINKTGRYILTRALLAAKDIDDVKRILYNSGYGTAYGVNLNIGLLPSGVNMLASPQIWNIEVAPDAQQNYSLLDAMKINTTYFHVNKYRRINTTENTEMTVSSNHRTTRIEEYPTPKSTADILTVFDLNRRIMQVYKDQPSNSSYGPIMTLSLDLF